MSKQYIFNDGTLIEWVDKETLRYTEKGFSVSIWVDFEPGFFNSGRIIKASSLENWDVKPEIQPIKITAEKRKEILAKVQDYYRANNVRCSVEI